MSTEVTLPALGASVTQATVSRWLASIGHTVGLGEPIVEVRVGQVSSQIPAPASGVLLEVRARPDDVVAVGAVLAIIGQPSGLTATPNGPIRLMVEDSTPSFAPPIPWPDDSTASGPTPPPVAAAWTPLVTPAPPPPAVPAPLPPLIVGTIPDFPPPQTAPVFPTPAGPTAPSFAGRAEADLFSVLEPIPAPVMPPLDITFEQASPPPNQPVAASPAAVAPAWEAQPLVEAAVPTNLAPIPPIPPPPVTSAAPNDPVETTVATTRLDRTVPEPPPIPPTATPPVTPTAPNDPVVAAPVEPVVPAPVDHVVAAPVDHVVPAPVEPVTAAGQPAPSDPSAGDQPPGGPGVGLETGAAVVASVLTPSADPKPVAIDLAAAALTTPPEAGVSAGIASGVAVTPADDVAAEAAANVPVTQTTTATAALLDLADPDPTVEALIATLTAEPIDPPDPADQSPPAGIELIAPISADPPTEMTDDILTGLTDDTSEDTSDDAPTDAVDTPTKPMTDVTGDQSTEPIDGTTGESVASPVVPPTGLPDSGDPAAPYVTPLVRKLAAEAGVDLGVVEGSGVGGRIRKQDVIDAATAAELAAAELAAASDTEASADLTGSGLAGTTAKLARSRRTAGRQMVASLQASAPSTAVIEVDLTAIGQWRDQAGADVPARDGIDLPYLAFIARAAVEALRRYPRFNAAIGPEGRTVTYATTENLGIAIDAASGRVVPVIAAAGDLPLTDLARRLVDLGDRAQSGQLAPEDVVGATFTIADYGATGTLWDTPIIDQPQVASLGTGALTRRAVVVADQRLGEIIAIRDMMYLSLTYDHRLIDGRDAADFLGAIKRRLEAGDFAGELLN